MSPARWILLAAPPLLVVAVLGGLARLGLVTAPGSAVAWHGPLMIGGFFAAVISVERAVATGGGWRWAGPVLALCGAAALLVGHPVPGLLGMVAGAAVLAAATVQVAVRHPAQHHTWMALATVCLLLGELLWLAGAPVHKGLPLASGFLILTILGERLELSRLLPRPRWAHLAFDGLAAALCAGLLVGVVAPWVGAALAGGSLVLLAWGAVRARQRRPRPSAGPRSALP